MKRKQPLYYWMCCDVNEINKDQMSSLPRKVFYGNHLSSYVFVLVINQRYVTTNRPPVLRVLAKVQISITIVQQNSDEMFEPCSLTLRISSDFPNYVISFV